MGSQTVSPKIPVIDFSSLSKGSDCWISTRDIVMRALDEYGCFEAIFDNEVVRELEANLYPAVAQIFDLPMNTKLKYTFTDFIGMDGYAKPSAKYPLRESMGIREPLILDKVQDFTNLMWPSTTNEFVCETLHEYSKQLAVMDKMVKRIVFEHFGVEKYMDGHMQATSYSLRCTKYKEPGMNDEKHVSLCEHVDPGVLTILQQNGVNGLQMQTKDGTWFDVVPSSPSSFIVLAGYGLMLGMEQWEDTCAAAPGGDEWREGEIQCGNVHFPRRHNTTTRRAARRKNPTPLFKPFNNLQAMLSFLRASNEKQVQLGLDNQLASA